MGDLEAAVGEGGEEEVGISCFIPRNGEMTKFSRYFSICKMVKFAKFKNLRNFAKKKHEMMNIGDIKNDIPITP